MPRLAVLLALFLTATLIAFGGIYSWALGPILAAALLINTLTWRASAAASDTRGLDAAIAVFVAAIAAQSVPLPLAVRTTLTPHAARVERALLLDADVGATASLSLDVRGTLQALSLVVAVALTYFAARRIFSAGGVRIFCRVLSVVGALAAAAAVVQRMVSPGLIYGVWTPETPGGTPFGTVVNRNHFAAWLLMTSALTGGYLVMQMRGRLPHSSATRSLRHAIVRAARADVAAPASCCAIMAVTIFVAQSRSALLGLLAATVTLSRSLTHTWTPVAAVVGLLLGLAALLLWVGDAATSQLANRFAGTLQARDVDRLVIWRETLPMLRDFALTGVGAGAFERAMLFYQQSRIFVSHLGGEWFFNHAHNHYLQLATEGGLLLALPFVAVAVQFARLVARRLQEDKTALRPARLGAIAGLTGVAVQSIWEVPLTMPAAALLAATLAGLATCRPRGPMRRSTAPSQPAAAT